MSRRFLTIGCAAAISLSLVSCTSPDTGGGDATGSAKAGGSGGHAVVALSAEPDSLDPTTANTFVARVAFASFCESLYGTNEQLELVPQLAAELPVVSDDGLSVEIKLREGITFNDGTPFNAEAVKTTLERHMTLDTSARAEDLAAVETVEAVNKSTVRLTLSEPYSPLGAKLADRAGAIMSPTALEELGKKFGSDPVCVGPFDYKDRVVGSEMSFVKSEHYYDADQVKLDALTYRFITDPNVRAANLRSGDVNAAVQLNPNNVAELKSDPGLKILDTETILYRGLSINVDPSKTNNPLAESVELRNALEMSIDRNAINDVVFDGQHVVDCLPFPTQSIFRPSDVDCATFDPDAARQILKESGEQLPISVELLIPAQPIAQRTAVVIQQMANEVGFDVTIKPEEFVSSLDTARAGDFDTYLIGWSGRIDPDGNLSGLVTSDGSNNFSQLDDEELDELIAAAATASDMEERKDLYAQVLERIDEIRPIIYLYHERWFLGLSGITGVEYAVDGIPRFKTAELTG